MARTTGLTLELNNYQAYQRELRNLDRIIGDLDRKVDRAGAAFDKLDRNVDDSSDGMRGMASESQKSSRQVRNDMRGIEGGARSLESVGERLEKLGRRVSLGISAPAAALKGVAVAAAIEFESSFAGVAKTLDTTGLNAQQVTDVLEGLRDGIRDLATDIESPVAGIENAHNELARIAELGGQLGIDRDGLLGFTETIAQLTLATELTADAAATSIAQFANITGASEFDRIGSTIVALGNNAATTESQILEFGARLAGAGRQAGLSQADILGLGTAMASVGLNAEAGGTAMTRVLNNMGVAAAQGGASLNIFAEIAGTTAADFATLFEEDAAGALESFIEGLGELERVEQLDVMSALGFSDIRVQDTLSRLSAAPEILADAFDIANTAFAENNALQLEAEQRFQTTAAQLNLLKNNLRDVAITIGDVLLPGINRMVAFFVPLLQQVNDANPAFIQFGVTLLGIAAAAGPLMLIGSQLVGLFPIIGSVIAVVTGPIGLLVIGVGALIAIFGDLEEIGYRLQIIFDNFRHNGLVEGFQLLFTTFEDGSSYIGGLLHAFGLAEDMANSIANQINVIGDGIALVRGFAATLNFASNGQSSLQLDQQRNGLLVDRETVLQQIADLENGIVSSNADALDIQVEQGDTLWDLARQYDTTVEELMELNGLSDSTLTIGQELIISEASVASDELTILQDELNALDSQISALPQGIQQIFNALSGRRLFQRLFGEDDGAVERAEALFVDIRGEMGEIGIHAATAASGIRQIFSGDVESGLTTIRDAFLGIGDSVLTIFDLFANRNDPATQDLAIGEELFAINDVDIGGSSSPFTDLTNTIQTELENVANGDFSGVSTLIEDNLSGVFNVAVIAVGALLGGPVGLVIGIGRLLVTAVEADFLGIGTLLEESTLAQDVITGFESVIADVRTRIEGVFGNLFGADDAPTLAIGEDLFAINDVDTQAASPLDGIVNEILEALGPIGDVLDSTIIEGVQALGDGLVGFIDNVSAADWEGFMEGVDILWTNFIQPLIQASVVIGLATIGAVLRGVGNALPALGDAVAGFVNAGSEIADGDIMGTLLAIGDGLGSIGDAVGAFTLGAADGVIGVIEDLTGQDYASAEEGLGALGNQLGLLYDAFVDAFNLNVIINHATQQLDRFVLNFQRNWVGLLQVTGQDTTEAVAAMEETTERIQNVGLGLELVEELNLQQNLIGELDLSQMLSVTVNGEEIQSSILDAFSDPAIVETLGGRAQTLLDDAIALAIANGDNNALNDLIMAGFEGGLAIDPSMLDISTLLAGENGAIDLGMMLFDLEASGFDVAGLLSEQLNTALESGDLNLASQLVDSAIISLDQEGLSDVAAGLNEGFVQAFEGLTVDTFIEDFGMSEDDAIALGNDITAGLAEGLAEGSEGVVTETQGVVMSAKEAVEAGFEIESPSLYMQGIGAMLMEGLALGMNMGLMVIDPILNHINAQTLQIGTSMVATGNQWFLMTEFMGGAIGKLQSQVSNFIPQVLELQQLIASMGAIPVLYVSSSPPSGSGQPQGAFAEGGRGEAGAIYKVAEPSIGGLELIRTDAGGSYIVSSTGFDAVPPQMGNFMRPTAPLSGNTASGGGQVVSISYGDVIVQVPQGTAAVTPDVIKQGLETWHRAHPPRRELKGKL